MIPAVNKLVGLGYSLVKRIVNIGWLHFFHLKNLQKTGKTGYSFFILKALHLIAHVVLTCTLIGSVVLPSILICSTGFSDPEYQILDPAARNSLTPKPMTIPPFKRNFPLSL